MRGEGRNTTEGEGHGLDGKALARQNALFAPRLVGLRGSINRFIKLSGSGLGDACE